MATPRETPAPLFQADAVPAPAPGKEGETPPTADPTAFYGDDEESLGSEDEPPDDPPDPHDLPGTEPGPSDPPDNESEHGATGASSTATGASTTKRRSNAARRRSAAAPTNRRRPAAAPDVTTDAPETPTGATTRSGRKV
jgi:hypothetical protein